MTIPMISFAAEKLNSFCFPFPPHDFLNLALRLASGGLNAGVVAPAPNAEPDEVDGETIVPVGVTGEPATGVDSDDEGIRLEDDEGTRFEEDEGTRPEDDRLGKILGILNEGDGDLCPGLALTPIRSVGAVSTAW